MKFTVTLLVILAALALVWGKQLKPSDYEKKIRVRTVVSWMCKLLTKMELKTSRYLCKEHNGGKVTTTKRPKKAHRTHGHTTEGPKRPSGSVFHTRYAPFGTNVNPVSSIWYQQSLYSGGQPSLYQHLSGEAKEALDNLEWAFKGADPLQGCSVVQDVLHRSGFKRSVRIAANAYLAKHCSGSESQTPDKPVPVSVPEPVTTSAPGKKPHKPDANSGGCGVSPRLKKKTKASRIVGGNETGSCDVVPWQVRIKSPMGMCGGSIISDRHILTAAHCVNELTEPSRITVMTGDYDKDNIENTEMVHHVKTMTFHQQFDISTYRNDIALLTLYGTLDFSQPCVRKVCRDPSFLPNNMFCTVSGWGTTSSGGRTSRTLQMVQVLTFRGTECKEQFSIPSSYDDYMSMPEKQLCAGKVAGGQDSCQGDSGGPLVCMHPDTKTFVQVGVVSYGIGCAHKGFPGVYSSVAAFNPWVEAAMAQNP